MMAPSLHALGAIFITGGAFWLFASGRIRIELVSLLLIAVLAVGFYFFPVEKNGEQSGLEIAFGGFGHEALIAICCLMILGRGLVVTGALEPAALLLARLWRFSHLLGLLFSLVLGGLMSMFVNDTPVLVLMMPILINLAVRAHVPASQTLMPMNCAILIGGMATTIGTSTNLLVVSIAEDMGLPRMSMFHFTDIALVAALVALPYLWLVMPRLLPTRTVGEDLLTRQFHGTLHIDATSALKGLSLADIRKKLNGALELIHVTRQGAVFTDPVFMVRPGDILGVEGTSAQLREASLSLKTPLVHSAITDVIRQFRKEDGEDEVIAEMVVGADSALTGRTIKSAQIADKYGVAVIGTYRPNRTLFHARQETEDLPLETGDILLVMGTENTLRQLQIGEGAMVLEGAAEMPRTAKALLALSIFGLVVALAALHLVPIVISSLAGTIAMLATGCVKFDRLGRALSAKVIVLVAASIALGRALLETGAAEWLGTVLAFILQPLPAAGVLAAIMAFAALITNFSSNTAAAAVGTPIAISLAMNIGIPPEPLVLAVLFGCNLCYATPIAYQTNILIMSAGGYNFGHYVRAGLPLVILMIFTLSFLLVNKYGL